MDNPDIILVLPLPPSSNRIWRSNRGRTHKATEYKHWLQTCAQLTAIQAGGDGIPYRFHARIVLPATRRDPDNSIKPTLDMLQAARVITNDRYMRRLTLEVDDCRPATMLVELWATDEAAPKRRAPKLKLQAPVAPL